ncbi:metalloregulator ArsR/SmtB family transcription factor (plasmid) [Hymenobacter aerilatus]|uniref:Metalloregulator ArsR/SmtB family transcription factor n=1 Tax=Hymenobacter aerilatus TaxID=2932251 RepID=A0A8T9T0V6_9BACT|nr:metalloregulator ArsR/SmtB family transcription factor [Hymenobacter aerilatus]UOR07765.1 metalloregulator ArsR/SmtB family transcription factor [Hymenobacter aerilatus]
MEANACIRVFADADYIRQCQVRLALAGPSLEATATVLALAGNEVRLKLLYLLAAEQQLCVCDIADVLDMTVSAVSQHLRKLKDGGVVTARKVGQTVFYALSEQHLPLLRPLLTGYPATPTLQPAP